ncbi:adenylosuccinate lyase [Tenacibaculum sp. MEBiC06402]|uniref:adenylosuccinate lyase n=1 Tax=unclassified Tenacibaculum TaxID=2635139 RepID=UPI003B990D10
MSIDFLISVLNSIENPKKVNRNKAAIIVLEQPELIRHLIDLTFSVNDKLSIKAAWILEWICTHYSLDYILPYLSTFTKGLQHLHLDAAVRTCAKICEHLATAYTNNRENAVKIALKESEIDKIIENCFDWLLGQQKASVKAYSMQTLYLFASKRNWINEELEHLLRTKVIHENKACKARGRKIIELIHKKSEHF